MAREKTSALKERPKTQPIEPWNSFLDMDRMFRDLFVSPSLGRGLLIPELTNELKPAVDLRETEKEFILSAAMPGLSKEDIDINVTADQITLSGERLAEEDKTDEKVHLRQQTYGAFNACYTLPAEVMPDDVSATYKKGILEVHLPKAKAAGPHKVEVKAED